MYRYYLCYFYEDEQKALEDVLELNKEFIQPLIEKEVIRATGSAEKVFKSKDKQYKYKNETLIELLEISEYEQTHMKIIIGKEEYKATGSAEKVFKSKDKQYKYKNETLIELLEISEYEQTHMKIIIGKEEYKRRENIRVKKAYQEQLKLQGKLTEKEKISQRRQKIKALLDEGLKQKDICHRLNISKRNCIRDIKFLKEQGLI